MKSFPSGAGKMIDENAFEPPELPPRSPSPPSSLKDNSVTSMIKNPMPRQLVPSTNIDKTNVSVPDSAIADVNLVIGSRYSQFSVTGVSTPDSAVDVKSPSVSDTSTLAVRKLLTQALDSTPDLRVFGVERVAEIVSQANLSEATAGARIVHEYSSIPSTANALGNSLSPARAATQSLLKEPLPRPLIAKPRTHRPSTVARPSRPNSTASRIPFNGEGTLSRASSLSHHSTLGLLPPTTIPDRRIYKTIFRRNINVSTISSQKEQRSLYIDTWDENLGRRVTRVDRRPSSVREQLNLEPVPTVETVEDISSIAIVPVPAALVADKHLFHPGRRAPLPHEAEGGTKSRNPLKRFFQRLREMDESWDARRQRKMALKEETHTRKLEARQRRREGIANTKNAKLAIKEKVAEHRERQKELKATAKAAAKQQKADEKARARQGKEATKAEKRQDKIDKREETARKARDRAALEEQWRRENVSMRKEFPACGRTDAAMGRYNEVVKAHSRDAEDSLETTYRRSEARAQEQEMREKKPADSEREQGMWMRDGRS